ncbi:hypothetical protein D3C71_1804470 [compost metagenome]
MTSLESRFMHLIDLGGGHIARVNAADAASIKVDLEHDLCRSFPVFAEQFLKHGNHKLHRGVIVIEHDHLVHLGRLHS